MSQNLFEIEESQGVTTVHVHIKKLYEHDVPKFQQIMVDLLDGGSRRVIVDISRVDVMNSSGLGVLILTWDRLQKEGGMLVTVGLSRIMKELFERMRLDLILKTAATVAEAKKMMT